MTQTTKETANQDIVERLRGLPIVVTENGRTGISRMGGALLSEAANEIERLRGALRTIDSLIPKTKEITDFPYWVAIAGDIAEGALNGTWPAYGVMPAPAKEKE